MTAKPRKRALWFRAVNGGSLHSWVLRFALACAAAGCTTEYSEDPKQTPNPCNPTFEPLKGEQNTLGFAHDRGAIICAFGCGLSEPLAERAVSRIAVYGDSNLPAITVSSDTPSVAEFAVEKGRIAVTTHAPGTARLEVRDASGALVDAVPVVVKAVSAIETREDLTLMFGGVAYVDVDLKDELGCRMLGIGGVDYALAGGITEKEVTLADALASLLLGIFESGADEGFDLKAVAPGSGRLRISAPSGAVTELPVNVVDETAVAAVSLTAPKQPLKVGSSHSVKAQAKTDAGLAVESPKCAWELLPTTGAPEIASTGRDTLSVKASGPASATVRCSIGSATDELSLSFE